MVKKQKISEYKKYKRNEMAREKRIIAKWNKSKMNERIAENRRAGVAGEQYFLYRMKSDYFQCIRTGRGSDFKCRKIDRLTGRPKSKWKLYEIKTGNAKLSTLQKKTMKKYGKNYKVIRQKKPIIY